MDHQAISNQSLANRRLYQQRLSHNAFATPAEIVQWMGAVQAQDYLGAKWAVGMRLQHATDAMIEKAYDAGEILRTHVLRPTWHFVTPADIRWLLELTGPRIIALSGTYYRQSGLDEATMLRSNDLIAHQLEGNHYQTRAEIGAALRAAGIATDGLRLGFLMMRAELDAVICSGPRRGKQFTYALLDEVAPDAKRLPRDEALAELARRYFSSHGPATLHDFAWWSGLTLTDARAGLAQNNDLLDAQEVGGETYWSVPTPDGDEMATEGAHLLSTFDEFMVGYSGYDERRRAGGDLRFESTIVMGGDTEGGKAGEVIGSWRRTIKRREVIIELAPFAPFTDTQWDAVASAAARYGEFVELPVVNKVVPAR